MALSIIELDIDLNVIETGTVDYGPFTTAFTLLEDAINGVIREVNAHLIRQTFTVTKLCETSGNHTILGAGKHLHCKILDAFCVVHDNIPEEVQIVLEGRSHKAKFSSTEKKGSAKGIDILTNRGNIHWNEDLTISLSNNRRVSVYVTMESTGA